MRCFKNLLVIVLFIIYNISIYAFPRLELNEQQQNQNQSLKISNGLVPQWLQGTYIYNGPAKYSLKKQRINHWLDGLAMLYKFEFINGNISFSNKFINSDVYKNAEDEGRLSQSFVEPEISQSPKHKAPYYITNTNIHTLLINNKLVAIGETAYPAVIAIDDLSTLGPFLYDGDKSNLSQTYHELAHIKADAEGNHYNLRTNFGFLSYYEIYKIEKNTNKRMVIFKDYIKKPSYMHDMSITDNYIVVIASPLTVNPWDLKKMDQGYINYFKWDDKSGSKIYLVDKLTGKKILYGETTPFFTFHHVNAYEEDGKVIVDLITYENDSVIKASGTSSQTPLSSLSRLSINIKNKQIDFKKDLLDNVNGLDLPRINSQYTGKFYQYFYAVDFSETENKNSLVKIDLKNKNRVDWREPDQFACEPLFVKKPNSEKEDEGIILSIVYNKKLNHSYLLILDAQNLDELARAELPFPIPYGLHGNFYQLESN